MNKKLHTDDNNGRALSVNQIAWLLPSTFLIHQLEEYFGQFPLWYSNLLNAQLSNQDYILINAIALIVITLFAISYIFNKNNFILVALGTLVLLNGVSHILLSIFTYSYSPGTISGIVLFIPLGIIIFKKILPHLSKTKRLLAILTGLIILVAVFIIALII